MKYRLTPVLLASRPFRAILAIMAAAALSALLTVQAHAQAPPGPPAPPRQPTFSVELGRAVLAWLPSDTPGAVYTVQRTAYASAVCNLAPCTVLAHGLTGPAHTDEAPNEPMHELHRRNHYWISACNPSGCSKPVRASFSDLRPAVPTDISAARSQSHDTITWTAPDGASNHRIYAGTGPSCSINTNGDPHRCQLLADNVPGTAHVHITADPMNYWVSSCNAAGCTAPTGPATQNGDSDDTSTGPPPPPPPPGKPVLHLSRTTTATGEPVLATLSMPNEDTVPVTLTLTIHAPAGWSITSSSSAAACTQSLCRSSRLTPPGYTASLAALITATTPGRTAITAHASWPRPGAGAAHSVPLSLAVTAVRAPANATPQPDQGDVSPRTGACSAATGAAPAAALPLILATALILPAAALLARRRRGDSDNR